MNLKTRTHQKQNPDKQMSEQLTVVSKQPATRYHTAAD